MRTLFLSQDLLDLVEEGYSDEIENMTGSTQRAKRESQEGCEGLVNDSAGSYKIHLFSSCCSNHIEGSMGDLETRIPRF